VNRCEGIAFTGGCTTPNEFNYLAVKSCAAWGSLLPGKTRLGWTWPLTVSSLGPTFGRGGNDQCWIDIKNTDMMLIMGGNPAGKPPCGFKWAIEARYTQRQDHRGGSAAHADGGECGHVLADSARGAISLFLGGLIRYAIKETIASRHDYLVNYTNAAFIIKDGFKLPDDGCFPLRRGEEDLPINPPWEL